LDFGDGVPGKFAERFTGTGDCSRRLLGASFALAFGGMLWS
jgi:hypothetical protein